MKWLMRLQMADLLQKNHQMNRWTTYLFYAGLICKISFIDIWKIFLIKNYLGKIFKDLSWMIEESSFESNEKVSAYGMCVRRIFLKI